MGGKVSFPIIEIPKERIFIVTGANTGLGYEVAKWIAMMGGTVIIACRSEDRAMEAMRRMDKEYKELLEKGTEGLTKLEELRVEYMHLDLASFQSTKEFVEEFKKSGRKLHVLVCNAGVSKRRFEKTDDGFESTVQVNYLSHFLLIGQLLPIMKNSGDDDCRIVLVSSDLHKWPKFDVTKMNSGDPNNHSLFDSYGRSKLYQVMQMHCLQRRLRNTPISVTSCHPGTVDTEISRDYWDSRAFRALMAINRFTGISRTPLEGANTILYAAIEPELKGVSGIYFKDCKSGYTQAAARDETKQEEMWRQTMEFLKEYFTEEEIFCLEGADPTNT